MLTTKLTLWRIRAAGLSYMCKSYDMTNAFGTGDFSELTFTMLDRCEDEYFREILNQHRCANALLIPACDQNITL